jgi:hypothetical protein
MVFDDGVQAHSVACPLDERFLAYITDTFAYYAACRPDILWLDDDVRIRWHNDQGGSWLNFGCFCPRHMAAYGERIGRAVTREELVARLIRGGAPDKYRAAFLDVNGEMISAFVRRVAEAVHQASPHTKVGFMHGCPAHHSAEGRDWAGILEPLRKGGVIHTRPPLGHYNEYSPVKYLSDVTQYLLGSAALMPEGVVRWPEMESAPYSEFNKSVSFTRFAVECSLAAGTPGCTFNPYDMIGNGVYATEPGLAVMLGELKPYMDAAAALELSVSKARGVCVPSYAETSRVMTAQDTGSLFNLLADDQLWRKALPLFGVSVRSTSEKAFTGQTVAFSGQSIKCLTTEQIEAAFRDNFILLDGGAVLSLADLGLLHLAGIKRCERLRGSVGEHPYEEVVNGKRYKGIIQAKIPMYYVGDYVRIEYAGEVEAITAVKRTDGSVSGAGTVVSGNCFIWPIVPNLEDMPPNLCTLARQGIVQEVLMRRDVPMALNHAAVALFAFDGAYVVINAVHDDRADVELYLPGVDAEALFEINRDGRRVKAGARDCGDGRVSIGRMPRIASRIFVEGP